MFQAVLRNSIISQNVPVLWWRNLNQEKAFVVPQIVSEKIERADIVLAIWTQWANYFTGRR
jgi:hypothetical protein